MGHLLPLFVSLAEELLENEPEIAAAVAAIFTKQNPTPADWLAVHQQVLAKNYADYVPASALPAATVVPNVPPVTTAAPQSNAPISQPGASETASAPANDPYLPDGAHNPAYVAPK
jgi:hypothetical protein